MLSRLRWEISLHLVFYLLLVVPAGAGVFPKWLQEAVAISFVLAKLPSKELYLVGIHVFRPFFCCRYIGSDSV